MTAKKKPLNIGYLFLADLLYLLLLSYVFMLSMGALHTQDHHATPTLSYPPSRS